MKELYGYDAIEAAEENPHSWKLSVKPNEVDGDGGPIDLEKAYEIAREDPGLVVGEYIDPTDPKLTLPSEKQIEEAIKTFDEIKKAGGLTIQHIEPSCEEPPFLKNLLP